MPYFHCGPSSSKITPEIESKRQDVVLKKYREEDDKKTMCLKMIQTNSIILSIVKTKVTMMILKIRIMNIKILITNKYKIVIK